MRYPYDRRMDGNAKVRAVTMRRIVGVVGVLAALAAVSAEARSLSAIKQDGTLRVGLTGDYAP